MPGAAAENAEFRELITALVRNSGGETGQLSVLGPDRRLFVECIERILLDPFELESYLALLGRLARPWAMQPDHLEPCPKLDEIVEGGVACLDDRELAALAVSPFQLRDVCDALDERGLSDYWWRIVEQRADRADDTEEVIVSRDLASKDKAATSESETSVDPQKTATRKWSPGRRWWRMGLVLAASVLMGVGALGWWYAVPAHTFADGETQIFVYRDGRVRGLPEASRQAQEEAVALLSSKDVAIATSLDPLKLRGPAERGVLLSPTATALVDARPTFSWRDIPGARSYRVELFASGSEENQGGVTTLTTWTPEEELERGGAYTWRVVAVTATGAQVSPPLEAPPGGFVILDADSAKRISEAEQRLGSSRVLRLVLYLRYGMLDHAEKLLEQLRRENPGVELLEDLQLNLQNKRSALQ
jgi:hypothetical protein